MQSLYLTGNIRLQYNAQPVKAVLGNKCCLLSETHGTHRYTVWAECRICSSEETYYVFATKPKQLMLFGETVADYFENHTEHTEKLCGQNVEFETQRKHITSPIQAQNVNAFYRKESLFILRTLRNRKHITPPLQIPTG
jgi:hypothetical protein